MLLMNKIDQLHLKYPFYGSRKLCAQLKHEEESVNRKRVQRLMRLMGIRTIYQKPRTSVMHSGHIIYPYLLREIPVIRANQVWCADITYIPMRKGFLYLTVIMDWYSRKALSWRLSNTLDADTCIDALTEAIARYGTPDIFNTDQGSQFTSEDFTGLLKQHHIQISMDGKGSWIDNVFIERLWRSLKYEEVYLKAYESMPEAKQEIGRWLNFYNEERLHEKLDYKTPDEIYLESLQEQAKNKQAA